VRDVSALVPLASSHAGSRMDGSVVSVRATYAPELRPTGGRDTGSPQPEPLDGRRARNPRPARRQHLPPAGASQAEQIQLERPARGRGFKSRQRAGALSESPILRWV
jgi:hypothetical protein